MDIKSPTGPPSPPMSDPTTTTDLPPPSYGDSIAPSDSKSQTHQPSSNENEKKQQGQQQQQQQPPAFAPLNPHTTAYSNEIQNQIANLSINISAVRVQKNLLNAANDQRILNYLTRAIEVYLGDFAQSQLRQGTLILIPLAAFPDPQALPSNFDLSLPTSFDKVVRVSAPSPSPSPSTTISNSTISTTTKSEPDYDFSFDTPSSSSSSTEKWYWKNAAQAQRIATYLTPLKKPLPPRSHSTPPSTSTNTSTPTPSKRTLGGFLRKKISSSGSPSSSSGYISKPSTRVEEVQEEGDRVEMKVSAEEVLFRTEDEFGIFETEMGWAVVLRLNVISS